MRAKLARKHPAGIPKCTTGIRGLDEIAFDHVRLERGGQILAIPLVRKLPPPIKKIIGDLSSETRVLVGLAVRPL